MSADWAPWLAGFAAGFVSAAIPFWAWIESHRDDTW